VLDVCGEIDRARTDRGLSYASIGRAVGLTGQHAARICLGLVTDVSLIRLAELSAVVGLDLSARLYPGASPLRDRGHAALLGRLSARVSPLLRWRTEVPVVTIAGSSDQRAWDATISGPGWVVGVEAETHVTDMQALERRVALKQRDGGITLVVLLLSDTTHHQRVLGSGVGLAGFPTPARTLLRALARAKPPPGSAIVCL